MSGGGDRLGCLSPAGFSAAALLALAMYGFGWEARDAKQRETDDTTGDSIPTATRVAWEPIDALPSGESAWRLPVEAGWIYVIDGHGVAFAPGADRED